MTSKGHISPLSTVGNSWHWQQSVTLWVKLDKKEGRGCFLLRSLHGTIHHTLVVQWQKDLTALNIHSCTHSTHTCISTHIPTHGFAHTRVWLPYNTYPHRKAAKSICNITLQWWCLNWLLFQDTVTGRDLYLYLLCPPMQLAYLCAKLY